jgi:hypothetical protein
VDEAQFWLPLVELILPFLDKETTKVPAEIYDEVIVDLKLLSLKSYDQSIYIHDYLNERCILRGTADYKFVEQILDLTQLDQNFQALIEERKIDLPNKFYHAYLCLQVKDALS